MKVFRSEILICSFVYVLCGNESFAERHDCRKILPRFDALDISVCGKLSQTHPLIDPRGSTEDERKQSKFMAALAQITENETKFVCGASILSSRFVLTAASCVDQKLLESGAARILIGVYNRTAMNDPWTKTVRIAGYRIHEKFDATRYQNDIAIINTEDEIAFNDFVGPICLPPVARFSNLSEEATILSGWGFNDPGAFRLSLNPVLRNNFVSVVNSETCWKQQYASFFPESNYSFFEGRLCVQDYVQSMSACQGMSGEPLVVIQRRQHRHGYLEALRQVQIGFVSFATFPCKPGKSAVFVNLRRYTRWILEAVANLGGFTPFAKHKWDECLEVLPSITEKHDLKPKFDFSDPSVCGALPRRSRSKTYGSSTTELEPKHFRSVAALVTVTRNEPQFVCGASILTSRFLLTAGSCLQKRFIDGIATGDSRVSIGEFDLTKMDNPRRKIMRITDYRIHEGHEESYNDIAIIKTSDKIVFNSFVGPICLPTVARFSNSSEKNTLLLGWGFMSRGKRSHSVSRVLTVSHVPVLDPKICWHRLGLSESAFQGNLCVDDFVKSKNACQGTPGEPLVIVHEEPRDDGFVERRSIQIGLFSSSFIPCVPDNPSTYVNLDRYTRWISDNVGELEDPATDADPWLEKCQDTLSARNAQLEKLPKFAALDVSLCGKMEKLTALVSNGEDVDQRELKYNAALYSTVRKIVFCGSSILSSRFVLTAAHCVESLIARDELDSVRIVIGEHNLTAINDLWRRTMKIADYRIHGNYVGELPLYNDIAIIKTSEEIIFDRFVGPVCLPSVAQRSNFLGEQAILTGWGLTHFTRMSGSAVLQRAQVPVVGLEECWRGLGKNDGFFEGHLCAGGRDLRDSCRGDSGGPLVIADHERSLYIQIGIVSSGDSHCGTRRPSFYVNLERYRGWILCTVEDMGGLTRG